MSILLREKLRSMEILRLLDRALLGLYSLALPLTSFDALGGSLNGSMPRFPLLQGEGEKSDLKRISSK